MKKRIFGGLRSRHPHAARAARNLALSAAVVAPLAISRGRAWQRVYQGEAAAMKVAKRLDHATMAAGAGLGTASVLGPLERWDAQRRQKNVHAGHIVKVQSRKHGTREIRPYA